MSIDGQAVWIGVGFLGQFLFGARFLVQWISSEACGKSVVPNVFWYLSVAGGVTLLSYAIYRGELVFIIGESVTLFVFLRNLQLLHRRPAET